MEIERADIGDGAIRVKWAFRVAGVDTGGIILQMIVSIHRVDEQWVDVDVAEYVAGVAVQVGGGDYPQIGRDIASEVAVLVVVEITVG